MPPRNATKSAPKKAPKVPPAPKTPVKSLPLLEEEEESSGSEDAPLSTEYDTQQLYDDQDDEEESDDEMNHDEGNKEDSGEDDEDSDAVEMIEVPKKRKTKAQGNKQKKVTKVTQAEDLRKISVTIMSFTDQEMKKSVARRISKSSLVDIPVDMNWIDAMAHFKIAICDLLFPEQAIVADEAFELTWSIPRVAPGSFGLKTEAHYKQLVSKALTMKNPAARITATEVQIANKENLPTQNAAPPPVDATAKAKPKSKARKEADILPANMAINDQIKSLREHWQCSLTTCRSEYCFIPADGPHFSLSHDHCEKWAAAILRGPTHATLGKPPNIALFDPVYKHAIVSKSLILQARIDSMAKEKGPQQPQIPPINIILPNNFQQAAPAPLPPILAAAPTVPASLLPDTHHEGPKLHLDIFCSFYCVSADIHDRLQENKITGTHAFSQITTEDLKDMGLKLGEIIDLKQAIKEWATLKD